MQIMENTKTFSPDVLSFQGEAFSVVNLRQVCGDQFTRLPVVLRLLMENAIRNMQGDERQRAVQAILAWLETGSSEEEIAFQPGRVLMHDTTSTPALVDVAAMRDALAEAGVDPTVLNPGLQVDVSVDHSLAVEAYAKTASLLFLFSGSCSAPQSV